MEYFGNQPREIREQALDAGDVVCPISWGFLFVALCGHTAVLAAWSHANRRPPLLGQRGRLCELCGIPLFSVQQAERHKDEHCGGGNDGTAGQEDVEVLTRPVHQNSC